MAKNLHWKGTVVRNVLVIALVGLAHVQVVAQSVRNARITFTCKSLSLEKVIEQLSESTGLYFVYSSDKITSHTPVTLAVKEKSLEEVLVLLEKQVNISFKIHEHHVAVKSVEHAPVVLNSSNTSIKKVSEETLITKPVYTANNEPQRFEVSELITQRAAELPSIQSSNEKYIAPLRPYFNSSLLKRVPLKYIKSTSRKLNSGWYLEAGSLINDYSMGMEIHAGFRKFYGVFSPTWTQADKFHGAFGVGSSFQFTENFSVNPIYTFASMDQSQTINAVTFNSPSFKVHHEIAHHQLKLMVQYALGSNVSFRAGPTFNQSITTSRYHHIETTPSSNTFLTNHSKLGDPDDGTMPLTHPTKTIPDVTTSKFWVGWEASFFYRIKFSKKK